MTTVESFLRDVFKRIESLDIFITVSLSVRKIIEYFFPAFEIIATGRVEVYEICNFITEKYIIFFSPQKKKTCSRGKGEMFYNWRKIRAMEKFETRKVRFERRSKIYE